MKALGLKLQATAASAEKGSRQPAEKYGGSGSSAWNFVLSFSSGPDVNSQSWIKQLNKVPLHPQIRSRKGRNGTLPARNMSRGKGVGFFEAGNSHPDFILWMLVGGKQYVTFIRTA
jgi:hypothetical protein